MRDPNQTPALKRWGLATSPAALAGVLAAVLIALVAPVRAQSPGPAPAGDEDEDLTSEEAAEIYRTATADLQALETEAGRIASRYQLALEGADRLEAELADLRGRVDDLENRRVDAESDLDSFTILTYKFGSPLVSDLDLLIDGGDLNDLVRGRKYLDAARGAGRDAVSRWRGSTQALTVERERLEEAEREHQDLLDRLRESREEMEAITARQLEIIDEAEVRLAEAIETERIAALAAQAAVLKDRVDVPAELAGYGNGRIPAAALTPIGIGSHRLWHPAAVAFMQLHADARAAGIDIGVTDSYRSYAAQVDVARRKGLYKNGGLAATPGTSNHGWGLALDLDLDWPAQQWMRANAARYGYVEDVPREPWHWTYHGG